MSHCLGDKSWDRAGFWSAHLKAGELRGAPLEETPIGAVAEAFLFDLEPVKSQLYS